MGGMFSKPKIPPMPEPPKPIRMPVQQDPEIVAAGKRAKESALRRSGRQATILTRNLQGTSGASRSSKLG